MNLLYIGYPESIHDIKWASFFSQQKEKYVVYMVEENLSLDENEAFQKKKEKLASYNIILLPPIYSFSLVRPWQTLESINRLKKYIKNYQIDIFHVLFATPHSFWLNFISIPIIITTRGSDILLTIPALLKSSGLRKWHDNILFQLLKKAFNKASYIVGTSQKQLDKTKDLMGYDRLHLIRTGIDVERIASLNVEKHLPRELQNKKYIFCPRYLQPIYQNELIISAFATLPNEIKNEYTLVFIDKSGNEKKYKSSIIEMLELHQLDYVIYPLLSQLEVWSVYHNATVTIMTPKSDGTPNSALEAMAAKCPLILGNLAYDKDLFGGTCLQMKSDHEEDLAELILKAIENYPSEVLTKAFEKVNELGNRIIEMHKLEQLYLEIGQQ